MRVGLQEQQQGLLRQVPFSEIKAFYGAIEGPTLVEVGLLPGVLLVLQIEANLGAWGIRVMIVGNRVTLAFSGALAHLEM